MAKDKSFSYFLFQVKTLQYSDSKGMFPSDGNTVCFKDVQIFALKIQDQMLNFVFIKTSALFLTVCLNIGGETCWMSNTEDTLFHFSYCSFYLFY